MSLITVTTESGGQYQIDSDRKLYRKTVTSGTSQVGETRWREYSTIQAFEGLDLGTLEEVEPHAIMPSRRLYFFGPDHWNITTTVTGVDVAVAA